jgi:hypothetical protein
MPLRLTPQLMDRLEQATRRSLRVSVARRGTEYVVTARRLITVAGTEALVGYLPMTGDELTFRLDELEHLEVIGL